MVYRLWFFKLGNDLLGVLTSGSFERALEAKGFCFPRRGIGKVGVRGLVVLLAACICVSAYGQSIDPTPKKLPGPVSAELRFDEELEFTSNGKNDVEARLEAILEKTRRLRQMTRQSRSGVSFDFDGVEPSAEPSGQGVQVKMSDEFANQVWSTAQASVSNDNTHPAVNESSEFASSSVGKSIDGSAVPVGDTSDSSEVVREIVQRIELLKRLRQESKNAQQAAGQGGESVPASQDGSSAPVDRPPTPDAIDPGRLVTSPTIEAFEPETNYFDDNSGDPNEVLFGEDVEQILKDPVDAMLLAESLYRTKNYKATLKALEAVDVNAIDDSDHVWVDLLTALAKRRLGDIAAAEAELRDIANIKSRDVAVPAAKFWLKQTEFMRLKQPLMEQLDAEYTTLLERAKSYAKPK
jgi:hypothetical protein